jgi:hypothetical protein
MIIRKQKQIVFVFCEGEAEMNLFGFLRLYYSNRKNSFNPINLGGFRDFNEFEKKYNKRNKDLRLRYGKYYLNKRFLFILDNDLEDSEKTGLFLKDKGHLVQFCNPNMEGLLLSIVGKKVGSNMKNEVFRKKCKLVFENHFKCEAHKIKENELKGIFDNTGLERNLPVLYKLLIENKVF